MARSLFRILDLRNGAERDADGRTKDSDWRLLSLASGFYITTDYVKASDVPDLPYDEVGSWLTASSLDEKAAEALAMLERGVEWLRARSAMYWTPERIEAARQREEARRRADEARLAKLREAFDMAGRLQTTNPDLCAHDLASRCEDFLGGNDYDDEREVVEATTSETTCMNRLKEGEACWCGAWERIDGEIVRGEGFSDD